MLMQVIDSVRATARNSGSLVLRPGDSLPGVIAGSSVSDGFGIYLIWSEPGSELLYVGRSGTVHQDGSWGNQGLSARLRKKQDGVSRNVFFQRVLMERELDALRIEWCELDHFTTPPFLAEAQILAAFLRENRCLPALNKEA